MNFRETSALIALSVDERHRQFAVRVHPLRAADSLQLAAALASAEEDPSGVGFVCFDIRLNEAASREGFTVLAP